jgi:hypothetical protein
MSVLAAFNYTYFQQGYVVTHTMSAAYLDVADVSFKNRRYILLGKFVLRVRDKQTCFAARSIADDDQLPA